MESYQNAKMVRFFHLLLQIIHIIICITYYLCSQKTYYQTDCKMKTNLFTLALLLLLAQPLVAQRIQQKAGRGVVAIDRTYNSSTRFGDPGKLIS